MQRASYDSEQCCHLDSQNFSFGNVAQCSARDMRVVGQMSVTKRTNDPKGIPNEQQHV